MKTSKGTELHIIKSSPNRVPMRMVIRGFRSKRLNNYGGPMADEGIDHDNNLIWTEDKQVYFNRAIEEFKTNNRRLPDAKEENNIWDAVHHMSNAVIKEKLK